MSGSPRRIKQTPVRTAYDQSPTKNPPSVEKHSPSLLPVRRWQPRPILEWSRLWREEFVELREGHEVMATGLVDEVTEDGTTIWIYLSSGLGRKMIHQDDGIDVWRVEARICHDRPPRS